MTHQHLWACTSASSVSQCPLYCVLQEALGCTEQLLGSKRMGKCMCMLMNLLFYLDLASKRLSRASHYIRGVWHQPQWLESTVPHGEVTLEGTLDGQTGGPRPQRVLCNVLTGRFIFPTLGIEHRCLHVGRHYHCCLPSRRLLAISNK